IGRLLDPILDRAFVHASYDFAFGERVDEDVLDDYAQMRSTINAQLGYLITSRIEAHLAADWVMQHDGVAFSELDDPSSPLFFGHDAVLDEDYLQVGLGASVQVTRGLRVA